MPRPTNQERALVSICDLADEAVEYLDALLSWTEHQTELARNTFDKPQQARIGEMAGTIARLSQTLYNINRRAQDAQSGRYRDE